MFQGLRSIIYPSSNLEQDKWFWTNVTGVKPYFDEPYYVGFNINGCELGLDPHATEGGLPYPVTYWLVQDTHQAAEVLNANGSTLHTPIRDVGGGIMMGTFKDPTGNIFGIIDNPNIANHG